MAPLPLSTGQHSRSFRSGQERSASFHGRTTAAPAEQRQMRRPKTQPDLLASARKGSGGALMDVKHGNGGGGGERRVPAKVLVNVTIQRSLGAVQVMALTEWRVEDLVAAVVRLYVKERRRPALPTTESSAFGLHYSQFSLECLDPKEKLIGLGSRNFFLCSKTRSSVSSTAAVEGNSSAAPLAVAPSSSSCSNEAEKASKIVFPWLRFMDFLL